MGRGVTGDPSVEEVSSGLGMAQGLRLQRANILLQKVSRRYCGHKYVF